jgi:hypothetical protein
VKHLHAIRLIGSWIQLGLFLSVLINGVLFRHSHRIEGKGIITHAHPYEQSGDSPFQNHHHSEGELALLDLISNGIYVSGDLVAWELQRVPEYQVALLEKPREAHPHLFFTSSFSLRGPPVGMSHKISYSKALSTVPYLIF